MHFLVSLKVHPSNETLQRFSSSGSSWNRRCCLPASPPREWRRWMGPSHLSHRSPLHISSIEVCALAAISADAVDIFSQLHNCTTAPTPTISTSVQPVLGLEISAAIVGVMAGVVCAKASLLPCAAHFSRTTLENRTCSTSSGSSAIAALHSPQSLRQLSRRKGSSSCGSRARAFSSASSSFQGRLCVVLTCPIGKVREGERTGVQASLLGVGAPEALVIGVVALLVFGPKGLAEVARTVGKSLRAFQPTIKEIQQVSREFKATLEQEIGLDELRNPSPYDSPPTSTPSRPNSVSSTPTSVPTTLSATEAPPAAPKTEDAPAPPKPYTTEDYVRITEEQAKALVSEEQRKASEAAAWGGTPPVKPVAETSSEDQAQTPADSAVKEGSGVVGSTPTELLEKSTDNGSSKL